MSTVYSHDPHAHESGEIIHLSQLSGYQTFGTMLALIRTRNGLSQQQIAEASKPYLRSRRMSFDRRMYGRLENDERFPAFEELEPLYRTFVEVYMVAFSEVERELYVQLAQKRLAQKRKKREHLSPEQWDRLAETLAEVDHSKRGKIRLVEKEEADQQQGAIETESSESRRLKALREALRTDTSHLLEREAWVEQMQSYLAMTPAKKVVTIQGHMGTGKSHALALLTQRLLAQADLYLIPYRFESGEAKLPEDQLATFLATVLADLTLTATDETRQHTLDEMVDQALAALKVRGEQGQKVVLLLDDAQEIFPSATQWSSVWEHFFQAFVRESHTASIYLATRAWPGWMDRRRSYIEETELPALSPEAGIILWQRFGLSDVPEALLLQASTRCGGNPQLIELRASHLQRPSLTFAWGRGGQVRSRSPKKSENTARLETLLAQDYLFDPKADVDARRELQHVLSRRLSHQASRMLECLACSPLGLPFTLLEQEFPHAELVYDELMRASLIDLSMAASDRAAVAPLVREAQLHALLNDGRKEGIEQRVTDLYDLWLTTLQDFRNDAEKSALIAEMVVRHIRQRQLLKAAESFISYGWLCALFGHVARIQRVFEEYVKENRGKGGTTEQEVGRLLLHHRIAVSIGQKFARSERDQIYQGIYDRLLAGEVTLEPHSELEVVQNMRLLYTRNAQYTEASHMFDNTLERLSQSGQASPEVSASFLYSNAQLFFSWSEQHEQHSPEALRYMQAGADTLKQSIAHWRLCLKHALPLQEHSINFRLARSLNDSAFALRVLGELPQAQKAIEESIQLKKSNGALPHSLAISLSEYSQILASQGEIRKALTVNEEAVQTLERAIENGDVTHHPELGMLLVERANILWQQARLAEAKPLLERAVELIGDKPSRQQDKKRASEQLEEIQWIASSSRPYQLDRRWFPRYDELVSYDDLALLTQAGPFLEDEQAEWERLSSQHDNEDSADRVLALIARSRKREFARSLQENCTPTIHYPCIQLDDVQERTRGLSALRKEIETQEGNAVVRRLYLDAIDEHLTILHLIESVALQDQDSFWKCNLQLYGKPGQHELKIALQVLCSTLFDARGHEVAGSVAQDALAQLKRWGISPRDIVAEELFIPQQEMIQQVDHKVLAGEKKQFPTTVVRRFFQDILNAYGASDWEVSISPARDHTYVDPNVRVLVLPQKAFTVAKIRQLLAEEIETHAFRALAGQHSPLALLGLGLARQEATEEGLARWYVRRVNQAVGGEERENTWIGTLTSGLASGVLTPALSFQELRNFLEKVHLVTRLLKEGESPEDALAAARQSAWVRACRTFRGVPNLAQPGCCSLKDRIYLRGHLELSRYLEHGDEQRLYVGAIGIEHLEDMAELHILAPNFPHRHCALALDLADTLATYSEEGKQEIPSSRQRREYT